MQNGGGAEKAVVLQLGGEGTGLSLFVPLFNPVNRTEGSEILPEEFAGLELLTFQVDTPVVVNIILPAVPAKQKHKYLDIK